MLQQGFIILWILLGMEVSAQTIYKCLGANGGVTLSDDPCPLGMRSEILRAPAPTVNQLQIAPKVVPNTKVPVLTEKYSPRVPPRVVTPPPAPDDGLGDGYGILSKEYRAAKKSPHRDLYPKRDGLGDGYGIFSQEYRQLHQSPDPADKPHHPYLHRKRD
ncbi:MAG: hypothetical protein RIT27_2432 [Pseudomonadota bacterium]|jgi:hypothetical protein